MKKSRKIWCAVSGHGYGHWFQVAPVLRALHETGLPMKLHVTGGVPREIIARSLDLPCTHDPENRDVGMIQTDPLRVDLVATRAALHQLHHSWEERLAREIRLLEAWRPDLILGNIPYLPLEAGARLGVPTVALNSLTWNEVIKAYYPPEAPETREWLRTMETAYGSATLGLRITPALPDHPFRENLPIPAITTPGTGRTRALREALGVASGDTRPLMLLSLGGIPANHLPMEAMKQHTDFHWIVDHEAVPDGWAHLHPLRRLRHWPFADLSASVQGIVSKPGYGMAIAAMANGLPFLYVCRGIFPDEIPIGQWCEQHGRAQEISREEFLNGTFADRIEALLHRPAPPLPRADGARVAAEILLERFLG
ncbi:MAG: hypothetical protein HQL95_05385 [Magnetococcales bacterium]|nr:hypothetical protein [Magnetococcales bacterium]